MGSEPLYAKYPLLPIAQNIFNLTNPAASQPTQQASLKNLEDAIEEHQMAPLYRYLAHPIEGILNPAGQSTSSAAQRPAGRRPSIGMVASRSAVSKYQLEWDEIKYRTLVKSNEGELEKFQKEEEDAEENAGETEVMAARGKRATFYARIGDKDKAIAAYEAIFESTGGVGTKIDLVLAIIRMGLFYGDKMMVKKQVERCAALVESGGDWDRRNRLKAYQGLHLLTTRDYAGAAPLLLDSLSTFTSYELCSYSNLVVYSVLAGSVTLTRKDFLAKVRDAPEIKAILGDGDDKMSALSGALSAGPGSGEDVEMGGASAAAPSKAVNLTTLGTSTADYPETEAAVDFSPLARLVRSLSKAEYKEFFGALSRTETEFLQQDRYLFEHRGWFVREMRLRAYQQLLQSYRVVGLEKMADNFGVTVDFLDRDLAKFIAAGRIPCTIDRVADKGIIETNRPDDKNKQYNDVVKQGDQLITKLQKYGQAVRLRGSERA